MEIRLVISEDIAGEGAAGEMFPRDLDICMRLFGGKYLINWHCSLTDVILLLQRNIPYRYN